MFKDLKCILWDWNGTLLDDVDINIGVVNNMLHDRGLPDIESADFYREHFAFPVINFYEAVGFDLENEDFDSAAADYVMWYNRLLPQAQLHDGVPSLLNRINSAGIRQLVLSATQRDNLVKQVERFGIEDRFERLLGVSDSRGDGKIGVAREWIKDSGLLPDEIVMIGDTDHDCEVASALGCGCVLIANGHQCRERLVKTGAIVVDALAQLPKILGV